MKKNYLPRIALGFALSPMLWLTWYIQSIPVIRVISLISISVFLLSFFGVFLQAVGLIIAIIALVKMHRRKNLDKISIAFSIFAIVAPFVWVLMLFSGIITYVLSYYF